MNLIEYIEKLEESSCGLECPDYRVDCKTCVDKMIVEHDKEIRADERTKVIDEFAEEMKNVLHGDCPHWLQEVDDNLYDKDDLIRSVDLLAEQLKDNQLN